MVNKNIIPEGTRDLILDECIRKKELELEIENILNKWGYKEVITPTKNIIKPLMEGSKI